MINIGPFHQRKKISPLRLLVLLQLFEGPKYGYEIFKNIKEAFEGKWNLKTGTFYPTLITMKKDGVIQSKNTDGTDYYSLTDSGRAVIETFPTRFTTERNFLFTYLRTILSWLPEHLKRWMVSNPDSIITNELYLSLVSELYSIPLEKSKKLHILDELIKRLEFNLATLRKIYTKIEEEK